MKRFIIPISGNPDSLFYSDSGLLLAKGYERIVIGERGAYIEFDFVHICKDNFFIPRESLWRDDLLANVYYIEHRSICDSYVKLYQQKKTVAYADYKIGKFYMSTLELFVDYKRVEIDCSCIFPITED